MPELPEVETFRRWLRDGGAGAPALKGQVIASAQVLWARSLAAPTVDEFQRRVPGQAVEEIGRRGKFLVFHLTRDHLLFHLRMSGDLEVEREGMPIAKHCRLALDFTSGWRLAFHDARKFGRVWLVSDVTQVLGELGPEPLDADFTAQALYQRLQTVRRQLKPLLLDQRFIAGLGNIYADEALHLARLHPLTPSNHLTDEQAQHLWASIRQVLTQAIEHSGTSIDWVYRGGEFQNYFRVYKRTGEPCPVCGTPIARIKVGQRGTHYCPKCQENRDEPRRKEGREE